MTNPSPYELFPVPPPAPWTYNDPRLIYNERCFFYNGGWDLVCLYGRVVPGKRKIGRSGAVFTGKSYPQAETINFLFKVCLTHVNEKKFEDYCEIKKYRVPKKIDLAVRVSKLSAQTKKIQVETEEMMTRIVKKFVYGDTLETMAPKETIVSSSLEKNLSPFVSSSLVLNKPKKFPTKN